MIKDRLIALRSELKTAVLHSVVFLTVVLLPQRLHFFIFRLLARVHPLLLSVHEAAAGLRQFNPAAADNPTLTTRRIALHQIVAYADFYLILFYGQRWFKKNVQVSGTALSKPSAGKGPFFFTPHYGQGVWAIHYLKQLGLPVARLHAPPPALSPPGQYLAHKLGRWRVRQLEKLTGVASIPVGGGGSIERMRHHLCDKQLPVLAMPDAPLAPNQNRIEVQLLGHNAAFAHGVMALAERENIPVYIYTMSINLHSGVRHLHLEGPFVHQSKEQLAQQLADISTRAIEQDPYAWHLWPWMGLHPQ